MAGFVQPLLNVPVVGPYLSSVAARVQEEVSSSDEAKKEWASVCGLVATYLVSARSEGLWAKVIVGAQVLAIAGQFAVADYVDHFLHPVDTGKDGENNGRQNGGWRLPTIDSFTWVRTNNGGSDPSGKASWKDEAIEYAKKLPKLDPKLMMVGHMIIALVCQKGLFNRKMFFMALVTGGVAAANPSFWRERDLEEYLPSLVVGGVTGLVGLPMS